MLATRMAVSPTNASASTPGPKIALAPRLGSVVNDAFHRSNAGGRTKVVTRRTGATTRMLMAAPEPESTMRFAVL